MINTVYRYINELLKEEDLVKELEKIDDLNNEQLEDVNKLIKNIKNILKETKSEVIRFAKIQDLLLENKTYLELASNMTDKDLIQMLTEYINVPNVDQEMLDEMVDGVIKEDNAKENIFRLAYNYRYINKELAKIEDYIISKCDAGYILEYIFICDDNNVTERVFNKIKKINNKKFIGDILDMNFIDNIFSSEQIDELKEYLN